MSVVEELDVIRLTRAVGEWPAGTKATVLEVFDGAFMVEVGDETRPLLDCLPVVPADSVEVVWKMRTPDAA